MVAKKKISIILPIYNVEKYLDKCVESVIGQTYQNLEIILVDDGSPDSCPHMCDDWKKRDERIKVIHQNNKGLAEARNTGILNSTGDLVAFVDSDDQISCRYIEILYDAMVKNNADIAGCHSCSDLALLYQGSESVYETVVTDDPLLFYLKKEGHAVWTRLYKKELFDSVPFEPGAQNEDIMFSYSVFSKAKRYVAVNAALYFWNLEPTSLSRSPIKTLVNQSERVYVQLCSDKKCSRELKDAALIRYCQVTYRIITRANRFGFVNNQIKQEFEDKRKDYLKLLKNNYNLIAESELFRKIDRFQVKLMITSYSAFQAWYKVINAIRGGVYR